MKLDLEVEEEESEKFESKYLRSVDKFEDNDHQKEYSANRMLLFDIIVKRA